MKILITGATGLIGRALIPQLLNKSYNLTALSRSLEQAKKLLPPQVKLVSSLSTYSSLDGFDAVINLAGAPIFDKRWTAKQKQYLVSSRIMLTQTLVELINRSVNPPHTFISGSATGFYGNREEMSLTETSLAGEGFLSELSQQWENVAIQANTRVCLLRTGLVLSVEGGALLAMLPLYQYGLGGKIGTGQQYWSWIHISDMVNGILFLLNQPASQGIFNLCTPNPIKNDEFNRTLASILHRPHYATIPTFILKALLGERSSLLLNSQNVIPQRLLEAGFQFEFVDLSTALQDLLKKY